MVKQLIWRKRTRRYVGCKEKRIIRMRTTQLGSFSDFKVHVHVHVKTIREFNRVIYFCFIINSVLTILAYIFYLYNVDLRYYQFLDFSPVNHHNLCCLPPSSIKRQRSGTHAILLHVHNETYILYILTSCVLFNLYCVFKEMMSLFLERN